MLRSNTNRETTAEIEKHELEYLECVCQSILDGLPFDPNTYSKYGTPPIVLASIFNRPDLTTILLSVPEINPCLWDYSRHRARCFRNALMVAAENNYENIVRLLLGADKSSVNSYTHDHDTALSLAVYHGHTNIVRLLLNHPRIKIKTLFLYKVDKKTKLNQAEEAELQQLLKAALIAQFYREALAEHACLKFVRSELLSKDDILNHLFSLVDKEPEAAKKIEILQNSIKVHATNTPAHALSEFIHESKATVNRIKGRILKEQEWAVTPAYGTSTTKTCLMSKTPIPQKDVEDYSIVTTKNSVDIFQL